MFLTCKCSFWCLSLRFALMDLRLPLSSPSLLLLPSLCQVWLEDLSLHPEPLWLSAASPPSPHRPAQDKHRATFLSFLFWHNCSAVRMGSRETLEGGKGCARASSYSWRKISPGNAREQCPPAIVSSPALWSPPPLLPVPLLWSALGHDPGENLICYLCSPKRLWAKRERKKRECYRSHWFLQVLLEAKERVAVGSCCSLMSCRKAAGSRDPHHLQSPAALGSANPQLKAFLLLPWVAEWDQNSGG